MKLTKYAVFLTAFLLLAAAAPAVPNASGICPVTVAAAEEAPQIIAEGMLCETISWTLDADYTLTVTGSGDMSELTGGFGRNTSKIKKAVVRNTDAANTITAIGAGLFKDCSALTEITMPDTVRVIGYQAFCGCSRLTACNLPASVTEIGDSAFYGSGLTALNVSGCTLGVNAFMNCTALKTAVIGAESIPAECFRGCTALESVTLSDSVERVEAGSYDHTGAFNNCPKLKTVSIGKGIEFIDHRAFHTTGTVLEVTFRPGVTAIPAAAFRGRDELTKVVLPDTLTAIGAEAFSECKKLSTCNFPASLNEIGTSAFNSTALTEVSLPGCSIGANAFIYCTALKTVMVGDGTVSIPAECFRGCTALERVTLSDSVKRVEAGSYDHTGAFFNCPSLKTVSIGKSIEFIDYRAFRTTGEALEVTFRPGVTAIPAEAFRNRSELTKVILPDTLTAIGAEAFSECKKLSACNFPSSLNEIGANAFNSTALTEVSLPGCSIGANAFIYCTALKTVTVGEGTEIIPTECFRGCTALESVTLPDSVKRVEAGSYDHTGAFFNCPSLKTVSIGKSIEFIDYRAFRTTGEALEVTFRPGVTAIPAEAFRNRSELTKVILPDTLTAIGAEAFSECKKLSTCNFPASLNEIGTNAFNSTALTEVSLPGCSIGADAFIYCTALKTVTVGEGTEIIPTECFRGCTALESVTLPDSVKRIEAGSYDHTGAFFNCPALKTVSVGKSIEFIDNRAFYTKGEALEVTFCEGVKAIPEHAFDYSNVTAIVLPETLTAIGANDISLCTALKLICIQAPDCVIADSESTIPSGARIRGYENSTAEEYARNYGRNFETFREDDPVIAYGNRVTGVSLTLDGRIGVNFYATLNSKAVKVVLEGPGGKVVYTGSKLADAKQADGSYCFTYRVNAIQADKTISLRIYDNKKLLDIYNSSFEKDSDKTIEYSVNAYIADAPQYQNDTKLNAMVNALDNYCKAAENYFCKGTHALNIPESNVIKTNDFKKQFEISLVLNSGTALRIYSGAEGAVRVSGANEIPLTAIRDGKNEQYFEITDISAFNLLNNITVKLDGVTYKICPTDYCALILAKSSDQKLRDVCNALYFYGEAAKAYGNSIQQ